MKSSPTTHCPVTASLGPDPRKRLSLAVKELTRLINHANQLAGLADQPFPNHEIPESPAQRQNIHSEKTGMGEGKCFDD